MTSILVVEDEEIIRINLGAYLEDEGYEVCCVSSGEEGLELLSQTVSGVSHIDLAIVDMRLPGISGDAFIQAASSISSNLKFLIHTGSSEYTLSRELTKIGVSSNDIILKPLSDMGILVQGIRRLTIPEVA